MISGTLLQNASLRVVDRRCEALPSDAPFVEVHGDYSLSYVRRGTFVTDTRLEKGARIVTFGNGMVVRELIVDLDDTARRLVWSASGGRLSHHNASAQVFADGDKRSRLVWTADLLPDELAGEIRTMMEHGAAAMKKAIEKR